MINLSFVGSGQFDSNIDVLLHSTEDCHLGHLGYMAILPKYGHNAIWPYGLGYGQYLFKKSPEPIGSMKKRKIIFNSKTDSIKTKCENVLKFAHHPSINKFK